jgi:NCS1 family nucleobase:cation symporter-1
MYQLLRAIWPSIAHLPNHLSASANITSTGLLCYVLYWLLQLPFLLVSPQRIRWLFTAKAALVPAAWLAMLAWACARVPVSAPGGLFDQKATLRGSALGWAWLSALNSALGLYATLAVNIPDFTVRAARRGPAPRLTARRSATRRTSARSTCSWPSSPVRPAQSSPVVQRD